MVCRNLAQLIEIVFFLLEDLDYSIFLCAKLSFLVELCMEQARVCYEHVARNAETFRSVKLN